MTRTALTRPPAIDFISPLPAEDCVRVLRRHAGQVRSPRLRVWAEEGGVRVEARARWGRTLPVWFFRFEGDLRCTGVGTHVCGQVRRNWALESWLLGAGALALLLAGLSVAANMPFTSLLAGLLLGLYALFYGHYARWVQHHMRALNRWLTDWLTEPQGRAGGPMP